MSYRTDDDPLQVPCPSCGVLQGQPCHELGHGQHHIPRLEALRLAYVALRRTPDVHASIAVTITNGNRGPGGKLTIRRRQPGGVEVTVTENLNEGESHTNHLWDGAELIIRQS